MHCWTFWKNRHNYDHRKSSALVTLFAARWRKSASRFVFAAPPGTAMSQVSVKLLVKRRMVAG